MISADVRAKVKEQETKEVVGLYLGLYLDIVH